MKLTFHGIFLTKMREVRKLREYFLPQLPHLPNETALLPVNRPHNDVDTAENRHDIGNLHTPQDMGQDL